MFNKDEIEKLKIENESLRNQLEVKEMMFQQLKEQYQHKNNELSDLIADVFLGFRKITEIATRNDYGQPEQKVRQIKEYAETSIPIFFKANLPQKDNEEPLVYWFSTGESLYRFFVNRLNGLKDENGKYKYEPQEQQKKALLKLTGLFEDDINNLYTYNRAKNKFGIPER